MALSNRLLKLRIALISFSLFVIPSLFFLQHRIKPPHEVIFTEPKTNITLRISGQCIKPFTYLGTDSRKHLLRYYDLIGTPVVRYSPPKMNWARAALLQYAFDKCEGVKWFVYTDSDGYVQSRDTLWQSFYKLAPHVVYQHGMWSLNSGVSAWHRTAQAREVLADWLNRYTPTNDFFAEQRAMLRAVSKYAKVTKGFPNGHIGWHIKGDALHKTDVANMGRMLCYYEHAISWLFLAPLWGVTAVTIIVIIRLRFTGRVTGAKPFVQVAVIAGSLLRNDIFVLTCATLALIPWFIRKAETLYGPWQFHSMKNLSPLNFTHILPGGKLMITRNLLCSGGWCITPVKKAWSDVLYQLTSRISRSKRLTVGMFVIHGIFTNIVPRVLVAFLCALWLVAAIAVVFRAVNVSNIFTMHDVADCLFRTRRQVGGKWYLRAVSPTVNSGTFEVVS